MKSQLDLFAASFANESDLRGALHDLFLRLPAVTDVHNTHGIQEHGRDFVFRSPVGLGDQVLCACVVKNDKISGSVTGSAGAMTVLHQVKQCLTIPYTNSDGEHENVGRVYVITPFEVSPAAMASISGDLRERSGQLHFYAGASLLELFEKHYPDYLLLKSGLLTSYVSTLKRAFEDGGALQQLSFKHGMLTAAKNVTSKAYVKPDFHLAFHSASIKSLSVLTVNRLKASITSNQVDEILSTLAGFRHVWSLCADKACTVFVEAGNAQSITEEIDAVSRDIRDQWTSALNRALEQRGTSLGSAGSERNLVRVRLKTGEILCDRTRSIFTKSYALQQLIANIGNSAGSVCAQQTSGLAVLGRQDYRTYCLCRDLTIASQTVLLWKAAFKTFRLDETLLDQGIAAVLISAPPGYGKTSFCKWSALYDGERFIRGESNVLPIYVPLHRLVNTSMSDFDLTFLAHDNLPDIMRSSRRPADAISVRLYLDGLDEISPDAQQKLMHLAQEGLRARPHFQIVATAREHVVGPWLAWLSRVKLSILTDSKVKELVAQLLDNDRDRITEFMRQLECVPSLKALIEIPLLCTLTVSVFEGTISLPESKAELYRIFVDLLCGGWDVAKGIKRRSEFNSIIKLRFLIMLASDIHMRRARAIDGDGVRNVIFQTKVVHLSVWERLIGDIVQDGLLVRDGHYYSFAHLSFQEYLCAKDIADPNSKKELIESVIGYYLRGEDWWREVIVFYAGMSNKQDEMLKTLDRVVNANDGGEFIKEGTLRARATSLRRAISELFSIRR